MGTCVRVFHVCFRAAAQPALNTHVHVSVSAAEIEHVSNLFQEKQAELQSAVLRVDQVTRHEERGVVWILTLDFDLGVDPLSPVNPAAGGLEERTSSFGRRACWPESLGPVRSCCAGAEEALPGAAGQSDVLLVPAVSSAHP